MGTIEEALRVGIDAVDKGNINAGKNALSWVVKQDPHHTLAWIWLACCVVDDEAKAECYRRAAA